MPANRGVVSTGLYRLVRHPIYLGYLITHVRRSWPRIRPLWNIVVLVGADVALMCARGLRGADAGAGSRRIASISRRCAGGWCRGCSERADSQLAIRTPKCRTARPSRAPQSAAGTHLRRRRALGSGSSASRTSPNGDRRAQVRLGASPNSPPADASRARPGRCRAAHPCRGRESAALRCKPARARRGRTRRPPKGCRAAGRCGGRSSLRSGSRGDHGSLRRWGNQTAQPVPPAANQAFSYVAVTVVLIPPRTEKSPTTVMRRGAQAATRSSRIWLVTAS